GSAPPTILTPGILANSGIMRQTWSWTRPATRTRKGFMARHSTDGGRDGKGFERRPHRRGSRFIPVRRRSGGSMKVAALLLILCAVPQDVPPNQGIAAKYAGDVGIERDPDVLFVESFETDSWRKTWQEISHPEFKEIETDPALVLVGARCL